MDTENNNLCIEKRNKNKNVKRNKVLKVIFVLLLSIIVLLVGLYGYWALTRTTDEKVIDRQLKGTTWKSDHVEFVGIPGYYIAIDEEYLSESPGALVQVEFHPILDKVTFVFNNGTETFSYVVTDLNSLQLTDEFYDFTITFYEDKVLSVSSRAWTYYMSME